MMERDRGRTTVKRSENGDFLAWGVIVFTFKGNILEHVNMLIGMTQEM